MLSSPKMQIYEREFVIDALKTVYDDIESNEDRIQFFMKPWRFIATGVAIGELNVNHRIVGESEWLTYGVADSPVQVLERDPVFLDSNNNDKFLCLLMTPIFKDDQPEEGGWRWHKWGKYIGDHDSMCEYLYDEEGIDVVYVYSVYELTLTEGELRTVESVARELRNFSIDQIDD